MPLYPGRIARSLPLALALVACAASPTAAQPSAREPEVREPVIQADTALVRAYVPPLAASAARQASTASFDIAYFGGVPAEARADVEAAATIWGRHLVSAVPIRLQVRWEPLPGRTLGQARPVTVHANRIGLPTPSTWYPGPLAEALAGVDLSNGGNDIEASFNSAFGQWHYGAGEAPDDRYSFLTVVLHELGHGLGILGSFDVSSADEPAQCDAPTGQGCWGLGDQGLPLVFDRFAEDAQGTSLLDESRYPNPSAALAGVLQSGAVRFEGETTDAYLDGVPVDLYAPANFEPGSSFSHLDEEAFPAGTLNALMTPNIGRAEVLLRLGPAVCAMLDDLGWTLGQGCIEELNPEPVELAALSGTASRGVVTLTAEVQGAFNGAFALERQYFGTAGEGFVVADTVRFGSGGPTAITDAPPGPGRYRYRLRPLFPVPDATTFEQTAAVTVLPGLDPALVVYPNPVSTTASASLVLPAGFPADAAFEGEVFDVLGRRLGALPFAVEGEGRVRFALDARRWASGVYVVRVRAGDAEKTARFTVAR